MPDDPSHSFPASRENATEKSQDVPFGVLETSANNLTICSQKSSSMSPMNTDSLDVRPLPPFEARTRLPATQPLTGNHLDSTSSAASEPPYKRLALSLSLNGSTSGLPSHPGTGPLIKLEQPESRVASQSSTTSSLEPLGETFEVPTILLSPGPRHSIAGIPSLSFTNDGLGRIHERPRSSVGSISSRALCTSPSVPSTSRITNKRRTGSGRTRSKSETTIDPTLLDSASNRIPYASPMSPYSHFHLQPCKDYISPPSSPRFPLLSSVIPSSPLIADVKVSKSRLLVTKTHCFYPGDFLTFQSCLLGFQIVFHPCNPKARIKHSEITLSMYPQDEDLGAENPVIKAIYPTGGILHRTGESSMVHRREENSIGLSLGVDPYGKLALRHTRSRSHDEWSSPYLLGSGIETNTLLLTMNEDPIAHGGVLPSLDFAVLLYLPSQRTQAFEAQLTVKASPGGELGAALRGMWTNPKIWTLKYDGVTELGHHTCETHSDGSRSVFLASGTSMTGHEGSDAF